MLSRFSFLNVEFDAITKPALIDRLERSIEAGSHNAIIGNHNLHSIYLHGRDVQMRRFYRQASTIHIDGMSLVFLGKLFGLPLERQHRTGYLDWFEDFLKLASDRQWRMYFIGGPQEIADRLPALLAARYPGIAIASHHGFLRREDLSGVYAEIRSFQPQVVVVGMGMQVQERFILEAVQHIETNVVLQCGAAMEFLVGAKKAAPRLLGQLGLEWLFRLASEPRRLGRRYLIEPFQLLPLIAREGLQRMSLHEARGEAVLRR